MIDLIPLCAVCGLQITTVEWHDKGTDLLSQELIHLSDADHDPVPAPGAFADAVLACDFCSARAPLWRFDTQYAISVQSIAATASVDQHDDSAWAACAPCKRLVLKGDRDRLAYRAMLAHRSRADLDEHDLAVVEQWVRALHGAFFAAAPLIPKKLDLS